jgi:hypothetical protein
VSSFDPRVAEVLERAAPSLENAHGNWNAVLELAGVRATDRIEAVAPVIPPAPRRRLVARRRSVIVAVLALCGLLIVLFATPAFGLRDLIVDFIGGRTSVSFVKSEPAPAAIKKRFLDLFTEAPPGMSPHVLPAEARQITFRGAAGQKRILWVAPTRGGGFCSILVGGGGGCVDRQTEQSQGPITIDGAFSQRRGQQPLFREVEGHVFSSKVATLTLEFQDHRSIPIPFVYVTSPIDAGFFLTGVPSDHQQQGHWPSELVARDAQGKLIATKTIRYATPPPNRLPPNRIRILTPKQRVLPTAPPVAPSQPQQEGSADGFHVVVGRNGAVQFTQTGRTSELERLAGHSAGYGCFRLTREFGIFTVRGLSQEGRFAPNVGIQLYGIGAPVDGCEIDGSGGHRWPDALGSHSPVEIALTAKGRAFFADRAAARDLAHFVRSGRMQKIRKESGPQILRDMRATYGPALTHSRIRYRLTVGGITFTETSSTGKTFRVVVVHGRIAHSNVEPYAKVF